MPYQYLESLKTIFGEILKLNSVTDCDVCGAAPVSVYWNLTGTYYYVDYDFRSSLVCTRYDLTSNVN